MLSSGEHSAHSLSSFLLSLNFFFLIFLLFILIQYYNTTRIEMKWMKVELCVKERSEMSEGWEKEAKCMHIFIHVFKSQNVYITMWCALFTQENLNRKYFYICNLQNSNQFQYTAFFLLYAWNLNKIKWNSIAEIKIARCIEREEGNVSLSEGFEVTEQYLKRYVCCKCNWNYTVGSTYKFLWVFENLC